MYKYVCKRDGRFVWSFMIDSDTDQTIEIHKDPFSSDGLQVGDIVIAKVESIARNIDAAFVRVCTGQTAYLPLENLKHPHYTVKGSSPELQQGDELIVQIKRDAIKGKLPAVTTLLSLQGTYVSVETGEGVSVSKKADQPRREQLRSIGKQLLGDDTDISILFRTKAAEAKDSAVISEAEKLIGTMRHLLQTAQFKVCYSKLYSSPGRFAERLLRTQNLELEKIVTDDELLAQNMKEQLTEQLPDLENKVYLYKDALLEMSVLYSLEHRKARALSAEVPLKSGGSIVISPTEALTAIDVNSGKNVVTSGKRSKEETVLNINLEAAKEIASQLRLRNMSGIIIVDFINMTQQSSEKILLEQFARMLGEDPVKTVLVDMTRLGLVEVTRKKIEKPLWEID